MTTVEEIHKGDIMTKFLVTVKDGDAIVDISTASEKKIITSDPNGVVVEHAANFETDGTDGKIYWITQLDTDLDEVGTWTIQAKIVMGGGTWRSSVAEFEVYSNLE